MEIRRWVRDRLGVGLGPRVIGLALVIALVAGGLVGALVIQSSRSTLRTQILSRNLSTAEVAGNLATSFVEGAETALNQLAVRPAFISALVNQNLAETESRMKEVMGVDSRFDNIVACTPDGVGWASGLESQWQYRGGSVADREWFQQALATTKPSLGIPVLSRGTGNPVITYAMPIFDDKGELRAVLAGGISLDTLADAVTGIRVSETAHASLVDLRQGAVVLADVNQDLILQPVFGQDQAVVQVLAGKRGTLETRNSDGEKELTAYVPVPRLPWAVLIREPAASAFAPIRALTERAMLLVGAVLLAALIVSILLAHRITDPLRRLAEGAEAVGSGNLDYKLGITARNEIGMVSRAFDHMTEELKTTLVSRDDLAVEVVERTRAEEELQEVASRQEAILAATPDIIMEVDEHKVYTWANQAGLKFFGADVVGREAAFYFEGEQDTYEVVSPLFNGREGLAYVESWQRREDGELRLLAWTCRNLHDEAGHVTGALSTAHDFTERHKAQEALRERDEQLRQSQKMEAVGQLAGGIAHDFNNLLTAIMGYSDLLLAREECGDSSAREDLEEIKHAAERATALTRQILAFSRRQPLRPTVASLNEVLNGMESLLRRTLGENIDLVTLEHPDLGQVEVDVHQFEQVLMNLAVNARDAMSSGGRLTLETGNVELDEQYCRVHPETRPGRYVMLAVSDNGAGMDQATREHIFEPFFTTKAPGEGTGLGLSTVYGILKQSNGSISVYSEPGKGTSFKIYLPRVTEQVEGDIPVATGPASAGGNETILLVEDEASLRKLVARILAGFGYRVLAAGNASEALLAAKEAEYHLDLLLTDLVLPGGVQGNDLASELLASKPDLPVLYVSGYTRNAIVHAGRLDQGVNFLAKPFTPEALARMVRTVLDRARAS